MCNHRPLVLLHAQPGKLMTWHQCAGYRKLVGALWRSPYCQHWVTQNRMLNLPSLIQVLTPSVKCSDIPSGSMTDPYVLIGFGV